MSTITAVPPAQTAYHPDTTLRVSQRNVIRSEWIKFRSLRSTVWTLIIAIVLMIGIGALFSAVTASQWSSFSPSDKATFNPVTVSLSGALFAQLAFGVLGVLFVSSEYSTGMIRSSMTVVPRRLPVLWGKIAVFAGVVGALSLITSFVSFFLGQALLSSEHLNVAISSPGALRRVIGAALYMTVAGIIGMAIGALLRHTAAGISAFVAIFFVIPPLLDLLPKSWRDSFAQYLPARAGEAIWSVTRDGAKTLSPWVGLGLLCVYAIVLVALAAVRLVRKDS
jgi:ABC-2 type transport system permease protein